MSMESSFAVEVEKAIAPLLAAQAQSGEWPVYGSDLGATKYSPLTGINRTNVTSLTPLGASLT